MILIIPDILDLTELRAIRQGMDDGVFQDGKATAGKRAKRVKKNEQLKQSPDELKQKITKALKRNKEFQKAALPRAIRPPLFSRYQPGMEYGWHVDNALMGSPRKNRTDVSVTVFLNGPDEYDGGELQIRTMIGAEEIKLPAGVGVIYPSTSLHRVAPVTRGERLVAVTWVESLVREVERREILYDMASISSLLDRQGQSEEAAELAQKTHANLLRQWAQT